MSKFNELIEVYKKELASAGVKTVDEQLLIAVAKGYGPSIYLPDASKVSSSDKEEVTRFKNNFLIKKLGLADSANLDAGIQAAFEQVGLSNKNKYRVVLSYLLVKHFKKEAFYSK